MTDCSSTTCERTSVGDCPRCDVRLPPGPYEYATTAPLNGHHGFGHVYLIDADDRKIGVVWGKPGEKIALVNLIISAREAS